MMKMRKIQRNKHKDREKTQEKLQYEEELQSLQRKSKKIIEEQRKNHQRLKVNQEILRLIPHYDIRL